MAAGLLMSVGSFAGTFAFTTALCSFGAAMGLLMSARHEEEVHQLAATLDAPELLVEPEDVVDDGSDGTLEGREELPPAHPTRRLPPPSEHDGTDGVL